MGTTFYLSKMTSFEYFKARGRRFTVRQLDKIKYITERYFDEGRTAISERVCRFLRWKQANGRLKDVACREVLRKLDEEGVINLPSPKSRGAVWNVRDYKKYDGDTSLITSLNFKSLRLEIAKDAELSKLWHTLVSEFHYLKSSRIVGRQIKYIVFAKNRPVACLGWGDASWQLKVRDKWIGWNASQRTRKRHLLVNNVRFLILPWVKVPNFASYILAKCSHAVVNDWEEKNAFRPVLLETFVDTKKFIGTCYRAANWTELGTTSGYAKSGSYHYNSQSPKTLYVYPVNKKFSALLKGRGK